jgi:hypothetical protein
MKPVWAQRIISLCLLLACANAWALDLSGGKRGKVIDFEDETVEGVNKKPYDSFSQLSDGNKKRRRAHLYRKRAGFRAETIETLKEVRYAQ